MRTSESRMAVLTSCFISICLQELDVLTKTLLAKGGESNNFIREDVDKALINMIDHVSSQRALLALISGGAS